MSSADAARRALEEHVLDEVGDAAALGRFVARPARQPDADADRSDLRHPLGEKTKTVPENLSRKGDPVNLALVRWSPAT